MALGMVWYQCPVCGQNYDVVSGLCWRPDCSDGRRLIKREDKDKEKK